ncbi:DUF4169 family protein [Sphingomonas sanxanigenens]|uniref:Uncharacterized protein n=1 Tax=Sphingomonas sanxanigenens DSM 19645 = NX02 TaxID=1123269 RepID=W0ADH3_9SPHN|nr:DUF4169 family protein [Sphingomonas sanxanigenens]AHE54577.1 hypothetical protein NX02_14460 [Sphingomonas sanxanigenens DSM 19645 = NX02]
MGEVVNLRLTRKAKARATAETVAAANRAKFGRTLAERRAEADEQARREALLEGARREGREEDADHTRG